MCVYRLGFGEFEAYITYPEFISAYLGMMIKNLDNFIRCILNASYMVLYYESFELCKREIY